MTTSKQIIKQRSTIGQGGDTLSASSDNGYEFNPAEIGLIHLKELIKEQISQIQESLGAIDSNSEINRQFQNLQQKVIAPIDDMIGGKITNSLKKNFRNHTFRVSMRSHAVPTLGPGGAKNDIRYVLSFVTWTNGPTSHEVYYFLREKFLSYMPSKEFIPKMYKHVRSDIERRGREYFKPLPIKGRKFDLIEVVKFKVINKYSDKVINQYYVVDVVDNKMGIQNIKGKDVPELFTNLQEAIEGVYYAPPYDKRKAALMKKEISSEEPDYTNEDVPSSEDQDQNEDGGNDDRDNGDSSTDASIRAFSGSSNSKEPSDDQVVENDEDNDGDSDQ